MTLDSLAGYGLTLLLDASLKTLLVLALVGLALLLGRRASASARHLTALLGLVSFLALPLLTWALPGWRVPLWPRPTMVLPIPASPLNVPPDALPPLPPAAPGPDAASPAPVPPVTAAPALTPTMPAAPVRHPFPWPFALFIAWLLGVCITLMPTLAGLLAVHRLGRRCRRLTDGPLVALAQTVWQGRPLALLCGDLSDLSVVPMTWGWLRPVVLLPVNAETWPPDRLRVVLLHELAHIRRGDWPCQMLAHIVCALYWFHPGAWILARQLRIESERACDDLVLAAGIPPGDYARYLLEVIKSMKITDTALKVVLPMAQPSQVEGRLRAVLAPHRVRGPLPHHVRVLAAVTILGLTAVLAALRPIAQATPASPVAKQPMPRLIVVVDAGHGGQDTGAVAADGTREKDVNLSIARKLGGILGAQVIGVAMTRTTDVNSSTLQRLVFAARHHPQLLVSLHCDSQRTLALHGGTTVYYHGQDAMGRRLALDVLAGLAHHSDLAPYQIKSDTTRFTSGFGILRGACVPAVLVECGAMNNARDLGALRTPQEQQKIAEGIANGVRMFLSDNPPPAPERQRATSLLVPVQQTSRPPTSTTPVQAVARLKQIYGFIQIYRHRHGGAYPASSSSPGDLMGDMAAHPLDYGLADRGADNGRQATDFFTLSDPFHPGPARLIRAYPNRL